MNMSCQRQRIMKQHIESEVFHFLIAICCSNVLLGTEFLNYLQDAAL